LLSSFIINALMTVVIAAAGFIFVSLPLRLLTFAAAFSYPSRASSRFQLPDKPGHSRVYWLTADEDRIARSRVDRVKRLAPTVNVVPPCSDHFAAIIV
jgi:hypothetical protein